MKRFHLTFGLLAVAAFLLTGQYMDRFHDHLEGMPDGARMMFRSRHIYILLAGLLNLGLGVYFRSRRQRARRVLQYAGSALIILATCLLVAAFFHEPTLPGLQTPFSRWGLYAILAGTLMHVFGGAVPTEEADAS